VNAIVNVFDWNRLILFQSKTTALYILGAGVFNRMAASPFAAGPARWLHTEPAPDPHRGRDRDEG